MTGRPLAPDLAGAIAVAGIDLTLEPRPLQDALRAMIATSGGYCDDFYAQGISMIELADPNNDHMASTAETTLMMVGAAEESGLNRPD